MSFPVGFVGAVGDCPSELIIELYFTGKESAAFISEAVRFWVREYHVDGIHLTGIASCPSLADDPWLSRTKLFASFWEESGSEKGKQEKSRHLAEYNDGFLVDMRRLLKGDEDQMNGLIFRSRRNPRNMGVINYMAHSNGFTLADSVSYEMKHNEANGENNQDGSAWNYTWNCGVEGPSRKKKIVGMRQKQIRNALLILFLSQARLSFWREMNSALQREEIIIPTARITPFPGWTGGFWRQIGTCSSSQSRSLHSERNTRCSICLRSPWAWITWVCGHPDVSYHGVKAW